ncbi:hypothetical protein H4I96_03245 [Botrytis cinerea]
MPVASRQSQAGLQVAGPVGESPPRPKEKKSEEKKRKCSREMFWPRKHGNDGPWDLRPWPLDAPWTWTLTLDIRH